MRLPGDRREQRALSPLWLLKAQDFEFLPLDPVQTTYRQGGDAYDHLTSLQRAMCP